MRFSIGKHSKAGFTLIEMLVVLGVVGVLSSILIGYSRESSRNLVLSTAEAKALSLLSRAKFLTVETFFEQVDNPPVELRICGYGVHLNRENGELFIFQDRVSGTDCTTSDYLYFENSEDTRLTSELDSLTINSTVLKIGEYSGDELNDVVFIPPDPDVAINGETTTPEGGFKVELLDGSNSFSISVNRAGQVKTD